MRVFRKSNEKKRKIWLLPLRHCNTFDVKGKLLYLLSSATFWVRLFLFLFIFFFLFFGFIKQHWNNEIRKREQHWPLKFHEQNVWNLKFVSNVNVLWVDIMYRIEYVDENKRLDSGEWRLHNATDGWNRSDWMIEQPILTMTRLVLHTWCLTVIHHARTSESDNRATQKAREERRGY